MLDDPGDPGATQLGPRNSFTSRARKNSTPAFNNAQPKHNVALKIAMPRPTVGQGGCWTLAKLKVVLGAKPCSYGDQTNIHPLYFWQVFRVRVVEFVKLKLTWAVFFLVVTALYTGGQPVRRLTRGSFFVEGCLRALTREVCFREMLSRTLLSSTFWKRELPHLHGHIFPFIGTSSPSRAHLPPHLPLHWHIFPFIGTSSRSGRWGGGRGLGMVCFRESFREAFAGIREGPWVKNAQSNSWRACIR